MNWNSTLGKFETFARSEAILEVKTSKTRLPYAPGDSFEKFAALKDEPLDDGEGYLYVRTRAISSRVNKNNDGWPSEELARGYKTFVGRPIFVDHNNSDPRRARGVVIDARLHVEDQEKTSALDPYYASAPDNHKPPTWVELLMEVDAQTFPKLAGYLKSGKIDSTSMGANIELSKCSVCENEAVSPSEYCEHIRSKGAEFEVTAADGSRAMKKAYEDCYGITFFEDSFVFDPADETALNISVEDIQPVLASKEAGYPDDIYGPSTMYDLDDDTQGNRELNYEPQSEMETAPQKVDTLRNDILCKNCQSSHLETDPDGILRCPQCGYVQPPEGLDNPDLGMAERVDVADHKEEENSQEGQTIEDTDGVKFVDKEKGQDPNAIKSIEPIAPIGAATKDVISPGVINEMRWKKVLSSNDQSVVQNFIKTAARVETTVEFPGGIHFGTADAMKALGLSCRVTYVATGETVEIPGTPNMLFFKNNYESKQKLGLQSSSEIPIVVEAPDDQIEAVVHTIHSGGEDVTKGGGPGVGPTASVVKKPTKTVLNPTGRGTDEPKNPQVVSDQLKPVTSKDDDEHHEKFIQEAIKHKGRLTKAVGGPPHEHLDKVRELAKGDDGLAAAARLYLNVLRPASEKDSNVEKEADRRVIKREERPDGTRTEQIVEETGELSFDEDDTTKKDTESPESEEQQVNEEAETQETEENSSKDEDDKKLPWSTGSADAESKLLLAMTVADEAVEAGIIESNEKLAFAAKLEKESIESIQARRDMLSRVKNGTVVGSQRRVAGITRLPRIASAGLSVRQEDELDNIPIEAVYL